MFVSYVFLLGLVIGSFLSVVIHRLHTGESITRGRSFCPHCRHTLGVFDLVPVLSFVFLKGKCRYCGKKISWQYPALELATGALFALAYFKNFPAALHHFFFVPYSCVSILHCFSDLFFLSIFVVIFVYDLKHYLILDVVVLPAALLAVISNLLFKVPLYNILLGGAAASGFFLLQYIISKGKWIGFGDVKLGLLIGFLLGWPNVLVALFLSYFLGSFVGLGLLFFGKKGLKSELPFGTFLTVATVIAMFWGERILNWYLNLIR